MAAKKKAREARLQAKREAIQSMGEAQGQTAPEPEAQAKEVKEESKADSK